MKRLKSILKKTSTIIDDKTEPLIKHHIYQAQANIMAILAIKGYPISIDTEVHYHEYSVPLQ